MQYENTKPSEVIHAFLGLIATAVVNFVSLVFKCLWFVGDRTVKMIVGSEAESESEDV